MEIKMTQTDIIYEAAMRWRCKILAGLYPKEKPMSFSECLKEAYSDGFDACYALVAFFREDVNALNNVCII